MHSFAEQQAFFDSQRAGLCQALARGGGSAAIDFVLEHTDETERRILFVFGHTAFLDRNEPGHDAPTDAVPVALDVFVAFADAGIAECLRQAQAAADEETRQRRVDSANVISYNLAADLADCWDGTQAREQRHFQRGLKAAQDCIRWRLELDKGPGPFAIAFWARGMHQLSLGDTGAAVESFRTGLEYSRHAAEDVGAGLNVDAAGEFGVILATGYLGLAAICAGLNWGQARYAAALGAFNSQLGELQKKEDAQFGLEQLQLVEQRYIQNSSRAVAD